MRDRGKKVCEEEMTAKKKKKNRQKEMVTKKKVSEDLNVSKLQS